VGSATVPKYAGYSDPVSVSLDLLNPKSIDVDALSKTVPWVFVLSR